MLADKMEYEDRKEVYLEIIDEFWGMDCDTLDGCLGFDSAYDESYKEYMESQ